MTFPRFLPAAVAGKNSSMLLPSIFPVCLMLLQPWYLDAWALSSLRFALKLQRPLFLLLMRGSYSLHGAVHHLFLSVVNYYQFWLIYSQAFRYKQAFIDIDSPWFLTICGKDTYLPLYQGVWEFGISEILLSMKHEFKV